MYTCACLVHVQSDLISKSFAKVYDQILVESFAFWIRDSNIVVAVVLFFSLYANDVSNFDIGNGNGNWCSINRLWPIKMPAQPIGIEDRQKSEGKHRYKITIEMLIFEQLFLRPDAYI